MPREKVMTAHQVEQARRESLVDDIIEKAAQATELPDELKDIDLPAEQIMAAMFELLVSKGSCELHPIPEDRPGRHTGKQQAADNMPMAEKGNDWSTLQESTTLFMNGGKLIGIRPKDIAGLFYNEGGAPKGSVGDIKIFLKHSLIEVSPELAPQLCERLATCNICGYEVNIREDKGIPGQDAGPRVNVRDRRTNAPDSYRRDRSDKFDRPARKDADRREHGSRFERAERYSAPRREKFDRYEGAGKDGGFRKRFDRAPRQEADAFYTKFAGSKKPRKK